MRIHGLIHGEKTGIEVVKGTHAFLASLRLVLYKHRYFGQWGTRRDLFNGLSWRYD